MNICKVKHHRNSTSKTGNREPQQNYRLGTVSNVSSVSEVVQNI